VNFLPFFIQKNRPEFPKLIIDSFPTAKRDTPFFLPLASRRSLSFSICLNGGEDLLSPLFPSPRLVVVDDALSFLFFLSLFGNTRGYFPFSAEIAQNSAARPLLTSPFLLKTENILFLFLFPEEKLCRPPSSRIMTGPFSSPSFGWMKTCSLPLPPQNRVRVISPGALRRMAEICLFFLPLLASGPSPSGIQGSSLSSCLFSFRLKIRAPVLSSGEERPLTFLRDNFRIFPPPFFAVRFAGR